MLWTSVVVLNTKEVDFLLPCIRKKWVVVVCVFFICFHFCTIPFLFWIHIFLCVTCVLHTNVVMFDFEAATFMFVMITQPVCLAFSVGLTFVFVFMAKAFNFVFRWVPKTVSLPFFYGLVFYFVFLQFRQQVVFDAPQN